MYICKRYKVYVVLCVAMFMAITACTSESSPPTPADQKLPSLTNDLQGGKYSVATEIPGENITLLMSYSTDYDVKSWRVTDSKTLRFSAVLTQAPEGPVKPVQVFIEHVHVDVNLQSTKASTDGLPQDSMDDSLHSGDQPGFMITRQYPYEEVFSIEGFSESLLNGWGYATGQYGQSEISEKRLTERNLRDNGVNANKFTFIYDVVIGNAEDGYHKRIVVNEFKVPLG